MNNKMVLGFIVMALSFLLDSTITYFVPYDFSREGITIIPYIGTLMFCLFVLRVDLEDRPFFSVVVGLYYSIVYTDSLTIYVVFYLVLSFVCAKYLKSIHCSYLDYLFVGISTIFSFEVMLYLIMKLANITNISIVNFGMYRLLPTLFVGLVSTLFVYSFSNSKRFGDDDHDYWNYSKGN